MVRGGSPDQNLIVLDNIPLYYVNHLGGFVSVFNTHALSNVKMYKGIFPPKYGGRLSSVVNIDTKNGNLSERHSSLTLGLIVITSYSIHYTKLYDSFLYYQKEGYLPSAPGDTLMNYRNECVDILSNNFGIVCDAHHHESYNFV